MGPRAGEDHRGQSGPAGTLTSPCSGRGEDEGQFEYRELEGPETGFQLPFPNPSLAHRLLGQEHH